MSQILRTIIVAAIAGAAGALLVLRVQPATPTLPGFSSASRSPEVTESATNHEQRIVNTVEQASPAVVSVVITQDVPVVEQFFETVPDPFGGNFFNPFGFQVPRLRQRGTERREVGGGSGFLVSAEGLIVTNRHVVDAEGAEFTVFLSDGTSHPATVIARDPNNDLAVLDIDVQNVPHLTFANSDELRVGQSVIAIGNALSEFRNTVSTGVISGLSRSIIAGDGRGSAEQLDEVIQTDAAINPGNSGGPLLNLSGQVVGVNVAVARGSENIGFALPANVVASVVDSVAQTGKITRAFLGVRYVAVTPVVVEENNLSVDYGVIVLRGSSEGELAVIPGSPAARAGIVENDIILEIDGERLDEDTSLASIIRRKSVGDVVSLRILRNEQEITVQATLEEVSS